MCDLAESGDLREVSPLSPELAYRFYTYWNIVAGRRAQRPDIRLPFHHLSGDGIWSALDDRGEPSPDKKLTKCAMLPSDLMAFLKDPANRDKARHLLIAKYFRPSERIALYEMIGLPVPSQQEIEANAAYRSPEEARMAGREARFRIRVVTAYNYTCALTRYRLATITAGSIVDAAHIHEFRDSRNNGVQHLGQDRSGGVMVQIDHLCHRIERTPKAQVRWRHCPLPRASLHSDPRRAEQRKLRDE
jgi:putative restriction endonuclease